MSTTDVETRPPATPNVGAGPARRKERGRPAWLFIAPFGIFFVLFLIWPVIYMFITSLFDTTLVAQRLRRLRRASATTPR